MTCLCANLITNRSCTRRLRCSRFVRTTNSPYITICLINSIDQASLKPTPAWSIIIFEPQTWKSVFISRWTKLSLTLRPLRRHVEPRLNGFNKIHDNWDIKFLRIFQTLLSYIDQIFSTKPSKEVRTLSIFFNLIYELIILFTWNSWKIKRCNGWLRRKCFWGPEPKRFCVCHLKELQKCCRLVVILGAYGHVGAYESKFKGFKAKNGESSRGRNFWWKSSILVSN